MTPDIICLLLKDFGNKYGIDGKKPHTKQNSNNNNNKKTQTKTRNKIPLVISIPEGVVMHSVNIFFHVLLFV